MVVNTVKNAMVYCIFFRMKCVFNNRLHSHIKLKVLIFESVIYFKKFFLLDTSNDIKPLSSLPSDDLPVIVGGTCVIVIIGVVLAIIIIVIRYVFYYGHSQTKFVYGPFCHVYVN